MFLSQFDSYRKGKEHLTQQQLPTDMAATVLCDYDIAYCSDRVTLCKKTLKSINLQIPGLVMDPNLSEDK